jgi:hypothetical protein
MSSPNLPLFPLGILRCRDLVQLYYGVRMVTNLIENEGGFFDTQPVQIISLDPRRIAYDIVMENFGDANDVALVSTIGGLDPPVQAHYGIFPGATQVISRSFLTNLDAVTMPVFACSVNGNIRFDTREVFLTPLPIDEPPVG